MAAPGGSTADNEPDLRRLLRGLRLAALVLGGAHAWAARHGNNPAGISYLDIADAYMRGDFAHAVNGYWSPLYSLLLGPALTLLQPGPYYEASVAHLVNFLIYGASLASFDALMRQVMPLARAQSADTIPQRAVVVFGYAAFAWSSLVLINLSDLSADLLMAVFVYAAAALLVNAQRLTLSLAGGAWLGVALGLGYLAKAAMLPLAVVFLFVAWASRGEWRRNAAPVAMSVVTLALVAAPFVIALSVQKGRFTTGDVGKLVYAWFVNDVTKYAHWQGEPPGRGVPAHPDRKIHEHPPVFEYATPVAGTHPVWYDPSYWYEGLQTHIDVRKQVRALLVATDVYWRLALDASAPILALGVLLALGARDQVWRRVSRQWFLLLPGLVPFAMFALVHTETRFIGAFLVLVFLGVLLAVRLPEREHVPRMAAAILIGASMVLALDTMMWSARRLATDSGRHVDYEIAAALTTAGIRPGDQVGSVGFAFDAYWARLAGVRIVAEIPTPDVPTFWSDTAAGRAAVYDAFRRAGIRILVAPDAPDTAAAVGWQRLGVDRHAVYWLEASN